MFVGKGSFEKSLQPSQSSPHYASARNPGGLNCRSAALPLASLCFDRFLHPAYCRHRRQPGFGTRFAGLLRPALCLHLAQSSHCSLPFATPAAQSSHRLAAARAARFARFLRFASSAAGGAQLRNPFRQPRPPLLHPPQAAIPSHRGQPGFGAFPDPSLKNLNILMDSI